MNTCWVDFNDVFRAGPEYRVTTLVKFCTRRPDIGDPIQAQDHDEMLMCEAVVIDLVMSVFTVGSEIVFLRLEWPPRYPAEFVQE